MWAFKAEESLAPPETGYQCACLEGGKAAIVELVKHQLLANPDLSASTAPGT